MEAHYPSTLRHRKSNGPSDSTVEFTYNQSGLDERTLVKLMGAPTLTTCMYRSKELLRYLFERLISIAPRLIPVILFPLIVTLIVTFAISSSKETLAQRHDNKKMLQFIFIVVTSCYSLIFFAIAVDYSKVLRISRAAINYRRQQAGHSQREISGPQGLTTRDMHATLCRQNRSTQRQVTRITAEVGSGHMSVKATSSHADASSNASESDASASAKSYQDDKDSRASSDNANNSSTNGKSIKRNSNWWDSYALLRMNLHCVIYLTRCAFSVMFESNASRKSARRRKKNGEKFEHYLLRHMNNNTLQILLLAMLIIIALVLLTSVKCFRLAKDPQYSKWLSESIIWTSGVACYLQLHFITLLVMATILSRSPAEIQVVGTLGRWLLSLAACIILQVSIMPSVGELPECLLNRKLDNGFFAVFTDIEDYSDSPIVNSIGASRPKVIFLLSSLITAIISSFLYQMNILQMSLGSVGTMFEWLLSVSPIEGIVLLLNLFATQTNFLILIMPFLGKLSESELFCIFVLMLVKTPSEDNEYWDYKVVQKFNSALQPRILDNVYTYIPQRAAIRSMLVFPLIILFCRIIYPMRGKFGIRASLFRRLHSMNCGRPFESLGESLLYYVAYCIRSLCRYFVMIMFFHCLEFMCRFTLHTIAFKFDGIISIEEVLIKLITMPVSFLTDMTDLYPSKTYALSHYVVHRFLYPKLTYGFYFVQNNNNSSIVNTVDPILKAYNDVSTPMKEIVVSGSLNWDTIVIFVAFSTDCLGNDRRTTLSFLIRGCIAAILIYAAMHNLIFLFCDPDSLRRFHNVSSKWIETINEDAAIRNCSTVNV